MSLFSFIFLFTGILLLNNYKKLNYWSLFSSYIIIILLGNLSQGSLHYTFLRSFIDTDFQYFHDVIQIKNGYDFIAHYNTIQDTLTMHAKTHPPFAVWIQYILYTFFNKSVLGLSIGLSVLGLMSFIPLYKILTYFNLEKSRKNLLIIIFTILLLLEYYF